MKLNLFKYTYDRFKKIISYKKIKERKSLALVSLIWIIKVIKEIN